MTDETLEQTVAPAETPAPAPAEQSAEDIFSAAFSQFASPGEKPAETASTPEPVVQEAPPADAAEEVEAAPETPAEEVGEPVRTTNEPAPPAQEPPRFTADEWARFMAAQQQANYAQQPAPAPQQPEPRQVLSKEEVEAVQEFRKEWPDVAKAMDIQQKAFADNLLNYVFNQFAEVITPVVQQVEAVADRSHVMDIYDYIPDYDQVREPVINWVGKLPQSAFRNYAVSVVRDGDPSDIQQLVDQWRVFNGVPAPQPAAPVQRSFAAPAPARPTIQRKAADPAIARAAAAMAPVKSQRTAVVQGDDPNDFDGAFEREAARAAAERERLNVRH
jgi:hypothetical protein